MINHRLKTIYIHIPKTGGTSIETTLCPRGNELYGFEDQQGNYIKNADGLKMLADNKELRLTCLQHISADQIKNRYNSNIWSDYYKFTVVRNPWDLLVSHYSYTIQTNRIDILERHNLNTESKFKDYVKKVNLPLQVNYVTNNAGELIVDHVCRFENLQQDFDIVCNKIGISRQQLPHKNATKHKHYIEYYDYETREIVAEKCAKDIEYFDYTFGG